MGLFLRKILWHGCGKWICPAKVEFVQVVVWISYQINYENGKENSQTEKLLLMWLFSPLGERILEQKNSGVEMSMQTRNCWQPCNKQGKRIQSCEL